MTASIQANWPPTFTSSIDAAISNKSVEDYSYFICRGGWPLAINDDRDVALQQAKTFYNGLTNEDIFSLKDVPLRKDEKRAKKLLRAYARNVSTEASNESIKADLKENGDEIDKDTFVKYLLALRKLYQVMRNSEQAEEVKKKAVVWKEKMEADHKKGISN